VWRGDKANWDLVVIVQPDRDLQHCAQLHILLSGRIAGGGDVTVWLFNQPLSYKTCDGKCKDDAKL
jgi:hypothetical protein